MLVNNPYELARGFKLLFEVRMLDFLGLVFSDLLLTLIGAVAVIIAGWIVFALLYKRRVLTKTQTVLIVLALSVLGLPVGYYLWSAMYTVIGPAVFFGSIAMLCSSVIMSFVLGRGGRAAPSRPAVSAAPAGVTLEKPGPPVERVDEDVVRLKVEKTATESALRSLEAAVKEGAITKETFEKHKATYTERLSKIDSELSKRTKVGITKLEGEIEKVRKSYLDKLKDLSKKAISVRPSPPPTAAPAPPRAVAPRAVEPKVRLPEIPTSRMEERFEEAAPVTPRAAPPLRPAERPLSAAVQAAPSGPATISDLRREMMDELNRLKRLIGRAEA